MKVISLWQPYAALAVHGYKRFETRPFPPPRTMVVGDRFAIASTKQIKSEQQVAAQHPRLQRYYRNLKLPEWILLSRGCIVGTVILGKTTEITNSTIMELDEQEYVFGDWRPGRFAWELLEPLAFKVPISVRGQQGVWDYNGLVEQA